MSSPVVNPLNPPSGSMLTPELAADLGVPSTFDVELRIAGRQVKLLGLDFLRSSHEAYYFSLISSYTNRAKKFNAGEYMVEVYYEDSDAGTSSAPVAEDLSTRRGPISRFAFSEILRTMGELFAGEEVNVILRGEKTERMMRVTWDVLQHVVKLMRENGITVSEETLTTEDGREYFFLRREVRESEDGRRLAFTEEEAERFEAERVKEAEARKAREALESEEIQAAHLGVTSQAPDSAMTESLQPIEVGDTSGVTGSGDATGATSSTTTTKE